MIIRIVRLFVLALVTVAFVLFALANRQVVTVSVDPFGSDPPALALTAPLFIIILLTLITGVIVGGVAVWFGQRKWRRATRRYQADARLLAEQSRRDERPSSSTLPPFDSARQGPAP